MSERRPIKCDLCGYEFKLISKIETKDLIYVLNNSEVLYSQKEFIYDLLEYINVLLLKSKQIEKINSVRHVEEAKRRLLANSNYEMTIDNLLIKMWEEISVLKIISILCR